MEKKETNSEILERVTGLSKDRQLEILEEVKQSHKKLESCTCHEFSVRIDQSHIHSPIPKWMCKNCRGIVENRIKNWYELGFKHGQLSTSD